MARGLSAYLDDAARRSFEWGQFDCVLFLADWSVACLGADPAAAYRGAYGTAAAAQRIIKRAGGLAPLIDREFCAVGWRSIEIAHAGDIGVVPAITERGQEPVGALYTGAHWVAVSPTGLIAPGFSPLHVWSAS